MATIECILKVGPKRELIATNTVEMEKLSKLKPGDEVRVKISTGGRSLSSNALSHVWYNDISKQTSDTPESVRAYCKLHYGVPILRAESDRFRDLYDKAIRRNLTYEEKLEAMQILPVTSLMNKGQMNAYLNAIQMEYANRGVILETPKDSAYAKYIAEQAR